MKRTLLITALAAFAFTHLSLAQAAGPDDEKKALVQQVLTLWHVEDTAIIMAQKPAQNAIVQAKAGLQGRLTAVQQEATMKDIAKDVQKYIDEVTPIARAAALKVKDSTMAPLLMKNFNAEELRQLVAFFESPVKKKFEGLLPEFERTFGDKVADSARATIQPKIEALSKDVGLKMRTAATLAQQQ